MRVLGMLDEKSKGKGNRNRQSAGAEARPGDRRYGSAKAQHGKSAREDETCDGGRGREEKKVSYSSSLLHHR